MTGDPDGSDAIFGFDCQTGEQRWVTEKAAYAAAGVPSTREANMAVAWLGDRELLRDGDISGGVLSGIDPLTGDRRWSVEERPHARLVGCGSQTAVLLAPPHTVGDRGSLYGIDIRTGKTLWQQSLSVATELEDDVLITLTGDDSVVVAVDDDHPGRGTPTAPSTAWVAEFDAADGSVLWSAPTAKESGGVSVHGNLVLLERDTSNEVVAFGRASARREWVESKLDDDPVALAGGDRRAFIEGHDGVYARDSTSGDLVWSSSTWEANAASEGVLYSTKPGETVTGALR